MYYFSSLNSQKRYFIDLFTEYYFKQNNAFYEIKKIVRAFEKDIYFLA